MSQTIKINFPHVEKFIILLTKMVIAAMKIKDA